MDSPYFFDNSQSPDLISPGRNSNNYTPAFELVTGSELGTETDADSSSNIFHHRAFEEVIRQLFFAPPNPHNPLIPIGFNMRRSASDALEASTDGLVDAIVNSTSEGGWLSFSNLDEIEPIELVVAIMHVSVSRMFHIYI